MQLAFYKDKGNFYDTLIKIATLSKYSHCELVIDGVCYSASPREKGVRSKVIDIYSGQWDIIELPNTYDKQYALDLFEREMNKAYDWLGAIKSVVVFLPNHKNKWFCTEIIAAALQLDNHKWFTPASLYRYFKE